MLPEKSVTLMEVLVSRVGVMGAGRLSMFPMLYAYALLVDEIEGFEAFANVGYYSRRTAYRRLAEWREALPELELEDFVRELVVKIEKDIREKNVIAVFGVSVTV